MMEEYVNSLLWLDTTVWKQLDIVKSLHKSLRAGELTEELCPTSLLKEIGRLANTHGLRPLPEEWYYENIPVEPLMIHEGLMTFRVTLPYTDDCLYRRYEIQAFAVPLDDIGSRAQVRIQDDIALDTTTGYWFAPTLCIGQRPQLCHAGPRLKDAFPCERGLITGHEPDRKQCALTSTQANATTAQELLEGVFVLGETVRLACSGKVQEQTTLSRGVYKLRLEEGCILSGGRWALHGMVRRYVTGTARLDEIAIPPLDLAALIVQSTTLNNSFQVHLDIQNDQYYVPKYESMDNDGYPEVLVAHHLSWTAIGFIILLLCITLYVAIWVYRRRVKIKVFFADALFAKHVSKGGIESVKYNTREPEVIKVLEEVESATEIV